jgi:glutamate-5-semialdehyde dehydrogenase
MSIAQLHDDHTDLHALMARLGREARAAAGVLAKAPRATKDAALRNAAHAMRADVAAILEANRRDVDAAAAQGTGGAMLDRLRLDAARLEGIAAGLEAIADLDDPVGTVLAAWTRPNGLRIERVRVPIGVIGIVYESRPNVTADAGALCLKAGNAAILRGGSESAASSRAIHACLATGLRAAGLPEGAIQLVPVTDRAAVGIMLADMAEWIDLVVPRGGKSLVARVQREAQIPVLGHLEGICHVYVDGAAEIDKARNIALNAKMRRPGVCGAAETLLIDRACAATHLKPLIGALIEAGCAVRGDAAVCDADGRATAAAEQDWDTEYLDAVISARVVDGVDGAIAHIAAHGTQHTDSIVTDDETAAARFLDEVDSAIVLHNASTQFADGGEFGMGAEIGIATGKLHARGPVGVEQLTTFKYRVRGTGQIRP